MLDLQRQRPIFQQRCGGVVTAAFSGTVAKVGYDKFVSGIKGEYDLPMIAYTPERIFSNSIPLFDINFFEPKDEVAYQSLAERRIGKWSDSA